MIEVVADASVALKWFHHEGEEELEAARELIERHRRRAISVAILDLTVYEVGNALVRGVGVAPDGVATVLGALIEICPRIALTAAEVSDAVALAARHDLTVYDAAYAAAARARGAELVTTDRELLRAGLGLRPSDLLERLGS